MSTDGSDRRQFTRAPVSVRASIRPKGGKELQGMSSDLSLRGFFLECSAPAIGETECEATLFLSGGAGEIPVHVHGRVVRVTPTGVAIEFTSIELEAFTHLKNMVKLNSEDADKIDAELADATRRRSLRPQPPDDAT